MLLNFGRRVKGDVLRFWRVAYSSGMELETQIVICKELKYINKNINNIEDLLIEVMKMLNSLTNN